MVSKKTVTSSKLDVFSPFFLLCGSAEREQVAATAEQKTVCGLQYHRLRIRIKSSNLIEKLVSKKTVTSSTNDLFSPFFLCCHSTEMNTSGWWQFRHKRRSVGFNTTFRA
jgi:hypothetical protein